MQRNSANANCCSPSGGIGKDQEDQLEKYEDKQTGERRVCAGGIPYVITA